MPRLALAGPRLRKSATSRWVRSATRARLSDNCSGSGSLISGIGDFAMRFHSMVSRGPSTDPSGPGTARHDAVIEFESDHIARELARNSPRLVTRYTNLD